MNAIRVFKHTLQLSHFKYFQKIEKCITIDILLRSILGEYKPGAPLTPFSPFIPGTPEGKEEERDERDY